MSSGFVFGIRELDARYGQALGRGRLIVVAGHPGAGKTTFAVAIAYSNALRGKKTIYFALQEDREKLYSVMRNIGFDLESVEGRGLFKFVRLPVSLDLKSTAEWIMSAVSDYGPDILVFDSINALLNGADEREQRAWMQNFFYELSRQFKGLAVVLVELPYGSEKLRPPFVEFVSDAILLLKHRVEENVLVRTMEVRKARGSPITLAEIPFSIVSGKGIVVYPPPILEELPSEGEEVGVRLKSLEGRADLSVRRGSTIYIAHPPDARTSLSYVIVLGYAFMCDMRALVISYNYTPASIREALASTLRSFGLSSEAAERILNENFVVRSINPYAHSISQLYAMELELIESYRDASGVSAVVFDDVSALAGHERNYFRYLYNQLQAFRKLGVTAFRIGSIVDEASYRVNSLVSDLVFRFEFERAGRGEADVSLYIWKRWSPRPCMLSREEIESLVREIGEAVRNRHAGASSQRSEKE